MPREVAERISARAIRDKVNINEGGRNGNDLEVDANGFGWCRSGCCRRRDANRTSDSNEDAASLPYRRNRGNGPRVVQKVPRWSFAPVGAIWRSFPRSWGKDSSIRWPTPEAHGCHRVR